MIKPCALRSFKPNNSAIKIALAKLFALIAGLPALIFLGLM
jgi:hypothetical protein